MPVYAFENHRPIIAATTYIAPSAQIIGKVTIGERCYIGLFWNTYKSRPIVRNGGETCTRHSVPWDS